MCNIFKTPVKMHQELYYYTYCALVFKFSGQSVPTFIFGIPAPLPPKLLRIKYGLFSALLFTDGTILKYS